MGDVRVIRVADDWGRPDQTVRWVRAVDWEADLVVGDYTTCRDPREARGFGALEIGAVLKAARGDWEVVVPQDLEVAKREWRGLRD
ncbi:MAG: hypothetical protein ABEN55_13340 [Bradymonadaceae bacterium]